MSGKKEKRGNNQNLTHNLILYTAIANLSLMVILAVLNILGVAVLNRFINTFVTIMLAFLFILILRFFRAIQLIDQNANLLSQGKLNISDIIADKTKGLETLTIAFNDMKRNLLSFIESTKSNVIVLSDAVDKVTKSLDMSYKGNEQIAANMVTVAEKAQEQLKIVKATLENIEEVSARTNSITDSIANIENFVENTVKITVEGTGHLDKYNEQMDVISANLSETAAFIEALNTHLKEIDQVNGLIINITEQLKLLSLNSAVEAARAGEAGRGFVVVAQEMNKLSAATRESIGQINNLLSNILSSNAKVGESIQSCVGSFNISKEIFASVRDSFYEINKNANILNDDMKMVYDEARMISERTNNINEQGHILHDASNEISSITQDVAAVTEEELAENEEINNQALSLQNMLSGIERLLKRYKTSIVPVSQTSQKRLKILMQSPLDHVFWEGVRQGALYAQNELKAKNVDVEYIGFKKVDGTFNQTIKDRIDSGYDGIIVPGFIGNIGTYVAMANRRNIPVIAYNCDLPEGVKRLSYFGPNVQAAGTLAGELVAKALDGEGEFAIITGPLDTSINKLRRDSIMEFLRKKKKIKLVAEYIADVTDEVVYNKAKEALAKNPDIRIIIIVTGGIQGCAKAIEEAGYAGKTQIICFDYDQQVIELVKRGIVYAAMGQDPFGQGHDPIIAMYNYLVAGETPDSITYTRTEIIDARSVSD